VARSGAGARVVHEDCARCAAVAEIYKKLPNSSRYSARLKRYDPLLTMAHAHETLSSTCEPDARLISSSTLRTLGIISSKGADCSFKPSRIAHENWLGVTGWFVATWFLDE
jgi:hypothetical protein